MSMGGCAWCGRQPVTREHLLPQWLGRVLAEAFPSDDGYDLAYVSSSEAGEDSPRTYAQSVPGIVVKAVCGACNGGWMSELEEETKRFLEPMVRGEHAHLGGTQQSTLARWAAKVSVLLDQYEAGSVILGPTDMEQIRRAHAPLGFHIRLAFRADDEPAPFHFDLTNHFATPSRRSAEEAGGRSVPNSFSATFGLGRVAIAVVGGAGIANPSRWADGSDRPLTIWPPTIAGIDWPPKNPILRNRGELRRFHESFWTAILNPEFPRPDAHGHRGQRS